MQTSETIRLTHQAGVLFANAIPFAHADFESNISYTLRDEVFGWICAVTNKDPSVSLPDEPPLTGDWHHGNGVLVTGTVRIASLCENFKQFSDKAPIIFTAICHACNQNIQAFYASNRNTLSF